jgi:hypothetical protein
MKCLICGGKTLTGGKLCKPCRAALRRARDDTISELLPLPRRREALAYSTATSVAGVLPLDSATIVLAPPRRSRRRVSLFGRITPRHFRAAALASFVIAAGLIAFVGFHELHRTRDAGAVPAATTPAASEPHAVVQRVSPSTLLGTARDENPVPPSDGTAAGQSTIDVAEPAAPPAALPLRRQGDRTAKVRASQARASATVEVAAADVAPEAPPVIIRAPAPPAPPVVRQPAPDRGQLLAAALARCGGDFLMRTVCEHRARAQYCDGQWGQLALCPAGIANDHGQ